MKFIKDVKGHDYELALNIRIYRHIKQMLSIDLCIPRGLGPSGVQQLSLELHESYDAFVTLLKALLAQRQQNQKTLKELSDDDFYDLWFGPEFGLAVDAFFEEWGLFFQTMNRHEDAEAVLNILRGMRTNKQKGLEEQRRMLGLESTNSSSDTPPEPESSIPEILPSAS